MKGATKASFRNKKLLGYFSKAKMGECDQKKLSFSDKFGMLMPGLQTYFLEVSAPVLLKGMTKSSFIAKRSQRFRLLAYFYDAKAERYDKSKLYFCS